MKTLYSHKRMVVALALLASGLANTVEAQPTGAGGLVAHYVARLYIDPATGQGQCVGYFTNIAGITASLFSGTPGEETAYFTFRSDVFQLSPLPANGDLQPDLFTAGNYAIYFNPQPIGDWGNPDTFSSGEPIAAFKRPESFVSLFPQSFHSVIREELVSTHTFRFQRTQLRFRRHRTRRPDSNGRWQQYAVAGHQRLFARPPICGFGDCRRRQSLNSATPDATAVLLMGN
jgi:hypothetical protein